MFTNVCFLKKNIRIYDHLISLPSTFLQLPNILFLSMLWHPEDIITTIILKNQYIYPFLFSSYIYPFLLFFFFPAHSSENFWEFMMFFHWFKKLKQDKFKQDKYKENHPQELHCQTTEKLLGSLFFRNLKNFFWDICGTGL